MVRHCCGAGAVAPGQILKKSPKVIGVGKRRKIHNTRTNF